MHIGPNEVYIHDAATGQWLHFYQPVEVIEARQIDEIRPALRHIEQRTRQEQLYAAGMLSYEAAPAFDRALKTRPAGDFPLLWFGLYHPPQPAPPPERLTPPAHSLGPWAESQGYEEYARSIETIKEQIAAGHTYQVNYTLRMHASFSGEPFSLFAELYQAQPVKYAAYLDLGRYAVCSASPELFFLLEGAHLTGKPMKGTAGRGVTLPEDRRQMDWLAHSEKNRAENVMIVDMLRNDLGRVAQTGSVQTTRLFEVERYPTVWQMTSTVEAESRAGLEEIFAALFPCASITGAPKVRTMQIIRELEPTPRRVYTGSIGMLTPQRRAQFSVAIRTVLVDRLEGLAEYGVGGGIIWDSTSQDEYAECRLKSRLLTQPHPAFDLLESLLWTPEAGCYLLEAHLARLEASAEYFGYAFNRRQVEACLQAVAAQLPAQAHKLRLTLPQSGEPACRAAPLETLPPARLWLAPQAVDTKNPFLYHKTTARAVYEAARAACPPGCEPLLWNERDELTETDTANLVVRLDGRLYTPPVSSGLLAGTLRGHLLVLGVLHERVLTRADLPACEALYLINSVRGWRGGDLSANQNYPS